VHKATVVSRYLNILFYGYLFLRALLSFPTRRSSDLNTVSAVAWISRSRDFKWRTSARESRRRIAAATVVSKRSLCQGLSTKSMRSEEHTSELQSREKLVCRLLLEQKNKQHTRSTDRP